MNKNPFSLFDFLGYLFPGALALILILFLEEQDGNILQLTVSELIENGVDYTKNHEISLENICIFTVVAYALGHLVAYLSSITIEKFSIWWYGYPSIYLLQEDKHCYFKDYKTKSYNTNISETKIRKFHKKASKVARIILKATVAIFLFPITAINLLSQLFLNSKEFFTRPVDSTIADSFNKKKEALFQYLNIDYNSTEDCDYERVIYHYEYERMPNHRAKIDNYVALYGFFRSVTLILSVFFIFLSINTCLYINDEFAWYILLKVILVASIIYIFYMGFMKFYRRYTLEIYMCLLTDTSYQTKLENNTTKIKKENS